MVTQAHRYHPGERAAHERAGLQEQAEHSRRAIGTAIPASAATFLAQQQVVFLGAADSDGRTWATALAGPAGFARALGDDTLHLSAGALPDDPLAGALSASAQVGMIAIEPSTRRRMRLNGCMEPDTGGLMLRAQQVYANCPKYIQQRTVLDGGEPARPDPGDPAAQATTGSTLTPAQQRWIGSADTFFLATRSSAGDADCSHRGGNPGFVDVIDGHRLRFPDYRGNAMLMSLGNLLQDPRAGLLFIDWQTGSLLHLAGRAEVDWAAAGALPGAERTVSFHLDRVVERKAALPLRWGSPTLSRHNPDLDGDEG